MRTEDARINARIEDVRNEDARINARINARIEDARINTRIEDVRINAITEDAKIEDGRIEDATKVLSLMIALLWVEPPNKTTKKFRAETFRRLNRLFVLNYLILIRTSVSLERGRVRWLAKNPEDRQREGRHR